MNLSTLKITLIFFVFALIGCNNVFEDASNTFFEDFSPTTKVYKNELATKLKTNSETLHYTFNKLVEKDGKEYLVKPQNLSMFILQGFYPQKCILFIASYL